MSELKNIRIGGVDQWILVRGQNRDNPILLFLHGGPGSAQIAVAGRYHSLLEKEFVVVDWDQRGAGLSYSPTIPKETMTVDTFVHDTKELIDYLKGRFSKEKVFLAGHSWGGTLGALVCQQYPESIQGYVAIAPAVDLQENESLAYDYVAAYAKKTNNKKAMRELAQIGRPPYQDALRFAKVRSRWTDVFHARFHNRNKLKFMLEFLLPSEYNLGDMVRFLKGSSFSFQTMWPEIMGLNLFTLAPAFDIPVYFLLGRYDYTTPYDITVRYCEKLIAPHKEIIWFERSAHCIPFEEPNEFQRTLIEKLNRKRGLGM